MKNVTILGSTGSIGTSTLDVIRRRRDEFSVFALVAGRNAELLARQIVEFRPRVAVVGTQAVLGNLISRLEETGLPRSQWPELDEGRQARIDAATASDVQFVMSAIVGVAGLEATYEAVRKGKIIGLANKETLVASGRLVTEAALEAGTELIPVDSEHNGVHQCLRAGKRGEVSRVLLTASGGPFREYPKERLAAVTPADALNHPTWKMGQRITIDCATLMNKGFEVIEACWLFGLDPSEVDVVVHPQSSVHAMVEYADGSILAQISATDMRMPIQYALTYPDRAAAPVPRLDWSVARHWDFGPPDLEKFPLLRLAYEAQKTGGSATCTLNAADEIAVQAFLDGRITFPAIADVVQQTLDAIPVRQPATVAEVLDIDEESRKAAREAVLARAEATGTLTL
ncbi:MAG TPA: 1-deoxy-D-xylulose-5-phosphate reductoisomerase [Bryobacteraceae bacterium]|nr:1-deoxy-D-xylulose-5-phosphate reductoisomerase [Bryobacteraceae bacterium]